MKKKIKKNRKNETIVISLGGSVLVPDEIDSKFLKSFVSIIKKHTQKFRFIILVGGGKVCRYYQSTASSLNASDTDLDWIGIRIAQSNAELVRAVFKNLAHPRVLSNPTKKITSKKPIIIASGWKPGCSTDYDAIVRAKVNKAKKIINITNVDYLYTKNPSKYKSAKKLKIAAWQTLQKLVGAKWKPGLNAPFDPLATKLASTSKLILVLIGKNTKNLDRLLSSKSFKGTIIY